MSTSVIGEERSGAWDSFHCSDKELKVKQHLNQQQLGWMTAVHPCAERERAKKYPEILRWEGKHGDDVVGADPGQKKEDADVGV